MSMVVSSICPRNPQVWDIMGFSSRFGDIYPLPILLYALACKCDQEFPRDIIVESSKSSISLTKFTLFGFGGNLLTLVLLLVLLLRCPILGADQVSRTHKLGKCKPCLLILSCLEILLSVYHMSLMLKGIFEGEAIMYCQLLRDCSQTISWITMALTLNSRSSSHVLHNRILCLWCLVMPVLDLPQFYVDFCSFKMLYALKDGGSLIAAIIFGILLNIDRLENGSKTRKLDLLEDAFLLSEDIEENRQPYSLDFNGLCYWNLLTFKFVNPMIQCGSTKQLDFGDLIHLPGELNPSVCHGKLWDSWVSEEQNNLAHASLLRAICLAYGWSYLKLGILKVVNDSAGFVGPLLLNRLIRFLQEGEVKFDGYVYACLLGLSYVIKSFLDTQYTFQLAKLKLKLRASIMGIIYRKCLELTTAERSNISEGEIQTLMSIDADRVVNLCNSFHDLWSLPLQIGVALFLLYTQVKIAFVSGIGITILLIPVNRWISGLIATATEKMMRQKDERLRQAGELLTYIRTMKMYSWELLFADRLMETRKLEVKYLSTRKYLDAWCVFFWATTPTLFSLFTFGLFTLLGHPLTAATVFTCVALFNTLISPLNSFPWVINGLIDAVISTRRLSRLLSVRCFRVFLEQQPIGIRKQQSSSSHEKDQNNNGDNDMAVVIVDSTCSWSSNQAEESPVLNHINVHIPCGFLVAVVGEVGSGKSSLLSAILGEMRLIHGSICSRGTIAYASQIPWILSGTVQENVLFGKEYIAERYDDVIQACALDFDISLMIGGDRVQVGEKGVKLSGGQRARLALARAIYHGGDIYLLDDVLSAVDAQVGHWIVHNAILGPLMSQKTRILCTHNPKAISSADMVIVMDRGHIRWSGSSADFVVSSFAPLYLTKTEIGTSQNSTPQGILKDADQELELEPTSLVESLEEINEVLGEEYRKVGKVEFSIYKSYAEFASLPVSAVICFSAFFMQASRNGSDFWLTHWVDTYSRSQIKPSVNFYLAILFIFASANSLLTLVRAFSFSFGGLRAAAQAHNKLLNKLVNAPVCFFEQNSSGRILNRFSSDQYAIDDSLPFILNILLANFFSLMGVAIVLSYVQIFFVLALLPFWYIYRKLQICYRSTSRELRRLDNVSRSPIYASFTETLSGSSIIRAFLTEEKFVAQFTELIMIYQRTSYSEIAASMWLSLRLQLLAAFIITFIAVMAVISHSGGLPVNFGTPGLVGLALSYAAPVVTLLSSFLASFTETEKEMISVERIVQYMDVPEEPLDGEKTLAVWPLNGHIQFENVTMRYLPSSPPALHRVSFCVPAGNQVGIVGRTGAGKSSVLNALFRLNPLCEGRILLDGVDLSSIAVRELRSCLAVVPQSPFLFEGTLRDNLDPYKMASDSDIWLVLEKCHIKEEMEAAGGLDVKIKEAGTSLSLGQRQLICLARALLKSSKVLCLDECTANVDLQTAFTLQETISCECKGITVLTIAHRISTILNMDNVFILEQGILVEEGNPQFLLQDKNSRFSSFVKASMA